MFKNQQKQYTHLMKQEKYQNQYQQKHEINKKRTLNIFQMSVIGKNSVMILNENVTDMLDKCH